MPNEYDGKISIVVLTYGRVHLLRQCVENVLARVSRATREIVIWDNGSPDGTGDYLDSLDDPRLRVVRHPDNIGHNAYPEAFALTTAPYLVELDDDMIEAPPNWDLTLLSAFEAIPKMGFLASGLVESPHDTASQIMYHVHRYTTEFEAGHRLLIGPTGGHCAMTSRHVYDLVGGFHREDRVFFQEDGVYADAITRAGFRSATLADLKLTHAGGPYFSAQPEQKIQYYETYKRRIARKVAVKRAILGIPGIATLNKKYGWFAAPEVTASYTTLAELFLNDEHQVAGRDGAPESASAG